MSNNTSVLVTGAGGYIGRFVVKTLLDSGVKVTAVGHNIEHVDDRARKLDINIFEEYDNIFEMLGSPDVCLHMAWKDGFIHNSDAHMQYLYPHYKFIKDMIDGGLKHIAVMGTMHEIGYHEGEVNEDTPTNPYSLYGIAKNSLRQALDVMLKDKDIVFQWLRAFYIYGDDSKNSSIFSKIMQAEKDNKESFPFTTGNNMYDFISVDELAYQITQCVLQSEITGIINCCSGVPITLRDMVESFIAKNEYKIKLDYGVYPDRPYDSPAIWGDNKKIQQIIRYHNNLIKA